jgi:hypothetical protein
MAADPPIKPLPSATEAPILPSGLWNPVWYSYFTQLDGLVRKLNVRGILSLPGVELPAPITDGQVLVFDDDSQTFKPGSI